jgi:MFS family permease
LSEEVSQSLAKPNHSLLRQIDLRQTFTALRHRNYRLWFVGQVVSLFGTWMQMTAQGYFIYELTHSAAYLGYVGFAAGIPTWVFMLWGGVIADRISRRTLLIITQTSMMILAFILAALTFSHYVEPWHIIALAFLGGIANAFDAPARMAFVSEMVPREDMTNAIALNGAMFNIATAIGPAISGLTYAAFGPGWCFTINGVSFIAVIIALWMMRLPPLERQVIPRTALMELAEGFRYLAKQPMIRAIIYLVCITTIFGISFMTLIPAWAVKILGGDATTNGLLQSARGAGALVSALLIASLGRFQFKGKLLTIGSLAFPAMLIAFSAMQWLPLSLAMLFCSGIAQIMLFNMANSLVQEQVDDHFRGRVMGIYSLTFFGFMPLGALWMGFWAEGLGSPITIAMSASVMLTFAIAFLFLIPKLRRLP